MLQLLDRRLRRSPFYTAGLNFYILGKKIMARQFEPISGCSPQLGELVDRMLQAPDSPSRAARSWGVATARPPTIPVQ